MCPPVTAKYTWFSIIVLLLLTVVCCRPQNAVVKNNNIITDSFHISIISWYPSMAIFLNLLPGVLKNKIASVHLHWHTAYTCHRYALRSSTRSVPVSTCYLPLYFCTKGVRSGKRLIWKSVHCRSKLSGCAETSEDVSDFNHLGAHLNLEKRRPYYCKPMFRLSASLC